MKKTHIDVITKYFYPVAGGIENNIMQTYSRLQNNLGYDITIHTTNNSYTKKNAFPNLQTINGLRIKRYPSNLFGFSPEIDWHSTQVVALHNFDMFFFKFLLRTLFYKVLKKKKFVLVLTPHGGFNPVWTIYSPFTRLIKKTYTYTLGAAMVNLAVDGVRAVSEWEMQEESKSINPSKIIMIDNGLEDEAYGDIERKASSNIRAYVKRMGSYCIQIARIYPIKNIETAILAMSKIPSGTKLIIVGEVQDAEYKIKLEELINSLNLQHRVEFIGVLRGADKYYLLKHAKVMIHMALWESGCNVVREGMSQGLPCVVSNVYGLPGLVKNKINGFCLPVRDYEKVARKVNWLLDNANIHEYNEIKKANIAFGKGQSWTDVTEKMSNFYKGLLSNL